MVILVVLVGIPPEPVVLLRCQEASRRRGRNAPCCKRVSVNDLPSKWSLPPPVHTCGGGQLVAQVLGVRRGRQVPQSRVGMVRVVLVEVMAVVMLMLDAAVVAVRDDVGGSAVGAALAAAVASVARGGGGIFPAAAAAAAVGRGRYGGVLDRAVCRRHYSLN